MDEITRIMNHFLALACHALDVGSMSPIFWAFEERENLMEIYEDLSGARMHAAYYRPIYKNKILTKAQKLKILYNILNIPITVTEINTLLLQNKLWKARLINLGIITRQDVKAYGLTGILARSTGYKTDLRTQANTYSFYRYQKITSFTTTNGDCFDRYLLRMYEILTSLHIVNIGLKKSYEVLKTPHKFHLFNNMEKTISDFKLWSGGEKMQPATEIAYVESPKGVFGTTISINSTTIPTHCKIRSPSYANLLWLKHASTGLLLADLITLIGTIDIVFGEIDR